MEGQLVATIQNHLTLHLYENARFLCERLVASYPSEYNTYLLATTYYHSKQIYRAYHVLRGHRSSRCRYLFALCCLELQKYEEAKDALLFNGEAKVPHGAAGYFLLGKVYRLQKHHRHAITFFQEALRSDPLLWCAYEELCNLGCDQELEEFNERLTEEEGSRPEGNLPEPSPALGPTCWSWESPTDDQTPACLTATTVSTPSSAGGLMEAADTNYITTREGLFGGPEPAGEMNPSTNGSSWSTPPMLAPTTGNPTTAPLPIPPLNSLSDQDFITPSPTGAPEGPPAIVRHDAGSPSPLFPGFSTGPHSHTHGDKTPTIARHHRVIDEGKVRKVSGRLFSDSGSALRRSARLVMSLQTSNSIPKTPSNKAYQKRGLHCLMEEDQQVDSHWGRAMCKDGEDELMTTRQELNDLENRSRTAPGGASTSESDQEEGFRQVLRLIRPLREGYRHLCAYRCKEAIEAFKRLPPSQYHTSWVLCQVGRAYVEMVDYASAADVFKEVHTIDLARIENMELYSTVLWHLKRQVDLTHLGKTLVAMDPLAPQSWCALGNSYSLQKEHEAALHLFQRALQLAPGFTYAFTLCGHEYFANEDFSQAMQCYEKAILLDPRHYNAWYGMGRIYYQQEKYESALMHFRDAVRINPRSSVLHCYQGMTLHKLHRREEALRVLQVAIMLDPKNPLARYEKASVLISLNQYSEALRELEELKVVAPKEASVYFQMGQLYKKTGSPDMAISHFHMAMELQPPTSDMNQIKAAIEKVCVADDVDAMNML